MGRFSAETRLPVSWRSVPCPRQLAHHLRQLALRLPALALQAPDLALDLAELLLDGLHQPLDLLGRASPSRPVARSSSARRWSASRCASESPVCASTSAEIAFSSSRMRSRLGLSAAAAPAAPRIRPIKIPRSQQHNDHRLSGWSTGGQ